MFHVDPAWYQAYWFAEPPRSRRPAITAAAARLAVAVAVLGGGGVLLSHFSANDLWQGYQDWEQE